MTEKEKSQQIRHLSKKDITDIYLVLFDRFKEIGEPIPPFVQVNAKEMENLVVIPQTRHFGVEQYPTIESKAAILFYKINKGHIFPNGNKRISLACLWETWILSPFFNAVSTFDPLLIIRIIIKPFVQFIPKLTYFRKNVKVPGNVHPLFYNLYFLISSHSFRASSFGFSEKMMPRAEFIMRPRPSRFRPTA